MHGAQVVLLALVVCGPAPPPGGKPSSAPDHAQAGPDERRESLARAAADFVRNGRPDRGWSRRPHADLTHDELIARADELLDLFNSTHSSAIADDAALLLEIADAYIAASSLAPTPEAAFEALGLGITALKELLERYPDTPSSEVAMLTLGVAYWRLGTYDDKALHWFDALTRRSPDGVCSQLAWIAKGHASCMRGAVTKANECFAHAQRGANPVAAQLAETHMNCRDLDTPLGSGYYVERGRSARSKQSLCG